MNRRARGFTLIELLIVVAMITILATMAVPSYQDRVIRTQVAQALTVAEVVKKDVEDFYKVKGRLPRNNSEAGLPKAEKFVGNFVKSIQIRDGAIDITFGNRVNRNVAEKVLTLRPAVVTDAPVVPIAWVCGYATTPHGMTIQSQNNTSILLRHVPVDCRY